MKLFLISAVLFLSSVLAARPEGMPLRQNFLSKVYSLHDAAPEARYSVVLDPFEVKNIDTEIFDKAEREMERSFGYHPRDREKLGGDRMSVIYFVPEEQLFQRAFSPVPDSAALTNDLAFAYEGGVKVFSNTSLYIKGGLAWRLDRHHELVAMPFLHGAKGLAIRVPWRWPLFF